MGIDLATWRARIGLNYYHACRPLQTRWRSSVGRLYQPGVADWGVGEVMNDTPLVLKGCMAVVALSLILQYIAHTWPKLKGRGGGGKLRCHWSGTTSQVRRIVGSGGSLLLKAFMVMIPLLLIMAGDVELNPGPPKMQGVALTLKAAINALHSASFRWYQIGVQLDVPTHSLKNIQQQHHDPIDCLTELLDKWMKSATNPSPSWRVLIDALRAPTVGEKRLAEELEEKYYTQKEQDQGSGGYMGGGVQRQQVLGEHPTTSTDRHSSSSTPPPNEESHKPAFGCGCGKCTFLSFIDSGCPNPIPSASSFPYLDLSRLTHEQQEELTGRLLFESRKIMMRFQELVSIIIKSLKSQQVPPDELVLHIMTLGAFDPVIKKPQVPLFQHFLKELRKADTIPKVFLVLNDYFSFFNYDIVEHIIKVLGTKEDQDELERYKEEFNQYAKRRVYECLPQFGPVSETNHADIFVKVDSRYDNYTVAEIREFCNKLSEILRVSSGGVLRLCQVEKGCFLLSLQVPSFVQQVIFPLSREQEKALASEAIIGLTCGEYQYPDVDDFADNCEPNIPGQYDATSLHYAAEFGHLHIVKYLTNQQGCNPSCLDDLSQTPLHVAAMNGHMDIVKFLILEKQCDPMCRDSDQNIPLHLAAWNGHTGVVKFLTLELHCDPTSRNAHNASALHLAVGKGHLDIVRFFISEQNCDPNIPGQYGGTPLHYAASFGHLHIVKYLTDEQGCNLSCLDDLNRTPLHRATMNGHMDIVKFLAVEKQCDPMCRDSDQNIALHLAALNGHIAVVKFLTLEMHCDLTCRNTNNATALHVAVETGQLEVVQFFISDRNCDPNIPGQRGGTPLHYAAEFGHLHIVKYLTDEQGCNPSCSDDLNCTPLHVAALKGYTDIVKFFTVEKHCDPMCRDSDQNTPLHLASWNGHIDVVKFLTLEMHCDPTSKNANNATSLHVAVATGQLDIVRYFIDISCDPNVRGQYGGTLLHYAALFGHLHIVKYLTDEQGCNPLYLDDLNRTPLHVAAMMGHMVIVKFLAVEKQCDPMCRDSDQDTPLHLAAWNGHMDVVKFLTLEMHCNPTSRNAHNANAVHLAVEGGQLNIARFFISDSYGDQDIPGFRTHLSDFSHLYT